MKVSSVKEYFDTLPQRFQADGAKGVTAIFQFELSGAGGGTFAVSVADSTFTVSEAAHASPNVTLKMSGDDFIKMSNGDLKGQMAFMTGKMKVSGNIPLAMKMEKIFPPG
ncbi:MAG: SCP2 sterol-binding domain-containing protein [Polyangiales bacterium]